MDTPPGKPKAGQLSLRKKWHRRFPGLKSLRSKPVSHFSSGEPDHEELEEWADWHKGYKEKDYFKAYKIEVIIYDDDSLIKHWKEQKDKASFNRLMRARLKMVEDCLPNS